MTDELTQIGGRASFCEAAHYGELAATGEGSTVPWAYFLQPDLAAVLFADRFWAEINARLGTLLDRAEEDELDPQLSGKLADEIERLARDRYRGGVVRREVAWRSDGNPIMVTLPAATLAEALEGLVAFLRTASRQGRALIASL
ncbi:MAG TPA: hypothetical protein VND93_14870 [Myxococcales bacterium]|jgi:hypothetical protein|nr:hypothetical protein [Myxococcales bacterium]